MPDLDPFTTQRDVAPAIASELRAAGFDVADEIGRGGFGIVFRCVQAGLDRTVAVKVLTVGIDENRDRFLREQRAMGRLTGHPNIVGVLQVGEIESGNPFLVMPYYRRGSLDARIRRYGALPLADVLRLGVKMSGAVETAHRAQILHRDIKPGNILYTDYAEPVLSDFGIAHVTGAFKTATGTFTGSPAFTAPEILSGDAPTPVSDVYGLGSTLFCALTRHAAFERRSGEQVVTQFLRIATESAPDLREFSIPDDVSTVIETAMARDPDARPTAQGLGELLRGLQQRHGFPVDEMALEGEQEPETAAQFPSAPSAARRTLSNLPVELTSFVGRNAELAELKKLITGHPLVTVTGTGGVGKTRLALRAAAALVADFPDGVRLVELGELRDGAAVVHVIATALGLPEGAAATPRIQEITEYLCPRKVLLILDNCEQVVDAAAGLAETLLRTCSELRILATSREEMGISGEVVFPLAPLTDEAVSLFVERAAAAVPGFELTEENQATVAKVCSRLDGLPLALELAAAKLRAMSPDQILHRLNNRYSLLTRGSRGAPQRQRTLAWSVGWSYDLCTPDEQRLWARLGVFAGSFELQAAEDICGEGAEDLTDLLTSLVEKSVLIRTESEGAVRFRLLDTLRDYGREKIQETGDYAGLRRRHLNWYRTLIGDAAADWFSPRQFDWIKRLTWEVPNLREASMFGQSEQSETVVGMLADLVLFSASQGYIGENSRALDRALTATPNVPTVERIRALYMAGMLAGAQNDAVAVAARAQEATSLADALPDRTPVCAYIDLLEGYAALLGGDGDRACERLAAAGETAVELTALGLSLALLARAQELRGDLAAGQAASQRLLELSESLGEKVFRTWALWNIGIECWRSADRDRAVEALKEGLELAAQLRDLRTVASNLEVLAWIAADLGKPEVAAVLMAAAESVAGAPGNYAELFPDLPVYHTECDERVRVAIGDEAYAAARDKGRSLRFDAAVAYALAQV
ncbi:serine/threonine-protein kinase PknK [Mycobacterium frederiksbergense]|uniref:Serine/threonine-protein kinase PknK n=1 Tax=Mycolicibacterium frederiksbergense TaxID=117567 RepID=A0ABT6KUV4_9MYCO|nr:protein kinase [Mycolicibacterium frederiksbergense]MDH6194373.1 serine/threonine-protein kinase PknK [Mycolicibacterium frederiksbergense]